MPVTTSQAARALRNGLFQSETLTDAQFSGGQFDGSSLSSDTEGVVAEIQVNSDSPIDDALAVLVGQYISGPRNQPGGRSDGDSFVAGQTIRARPDLQLNVSGGGLAQDSATMRICGGKKPTSKATALMNERSVEETNSSDQNREDIDPLEPWESNNTFVGDGEYITLVANPGSSGSQTYSLSDSTFRVPILYWDGRGL